MTATFLGEAGGPVLQVGPDDLETVFDVFQTCEEASGGGVGFGMESSNTPVRPAQIFSH